MNWADLAALIAALIGPISAVSALHAQKSGVILLIVSILIGLIIGLGFALLSRFISYSILFSSKINAVVSMFIYMISPLFFMLFSGAVTFILIRFVSHYSAAV